MPNCLQNRFLFSSNEHAQSTTLGPKLMFSKVSCHFVDAPDPSQKLVSACILLSVVFSEQYDSRHTTRKISMHSFRSKTHILGICTSFRCSKMSVWFRSTYFTSKTRVSGGFTPFHCRTWPIVKISIGCIKCTSLCLQNHFLFCRNEHAQSTISV